MRQPSHHSYLPFVAAGELVAIAALGSSEEGDLGGTVDEAELATFAGRAAETLRDLRAHAKAEAMARGALRVQQLSAVGQMAATLAHEVRNPLAAIRSLVQFIRDAAPSIQEQLPLLSEVISEVDRISGSVEKVLHQSRVATVDIEVVDLGAILLELEVFIGPYARRRGVAMRVVVDDTGPRVRANAVEIRQVLLNLLMNACQALEDGGQVEMLLTSRRGGSTPPTCEVALVDDGPGIPAAIRAHLGEPFVTSKADGTGLGVAFCYAAIKRAGGKLTFDSSEGGGTRAVVALPLEQ